MYRFDFLVRPVKPFDTDQWRAGSRHAVLYPTVPANFSPSRHSSVMLMTDTVTTVFFFLLGLTLRGPV